MSKIKVGILFGGKSAEHEVSLVSAQSVMENLNPNKYEAIPIGISREGKWLTAGEPLEYLKSGRQKKEQKKLLPTVSQKDGKHFISQKAVDVIFPVLHGTYGEDGTAQGFLELANIPYVGAGVLASAIGMDKAMQKNVFQDQGLPVPKHLIFPRQRILERLDPRVIIEIETSLGYPCFTKPANLGSSIGIFKAHTRSELKFMLKKTACFDRKIIVEKAVASALEIEVAVLGNDDPKASVCGEIIPSGEFYDYDAKYIDGKSEAIIPTKTPSRMSDKIRDLALRAYRAIDCAGMARVDFLVDGKTEEIYLSEINTIPGFTSISMYPKLWQASGLSYSRLLDKLIQLALERYKDKQKNETAVKLKQDWYK